MMLAPVVAAAATLLAGAAAAPSAHNPHHAYRAVTERAITNDASSISGRNFDFIIAGGGVAGLTLAARLSEWSNQTVLCIEAGGDGSDVIEQIITPGFSYLRSLTNSAYDWSYETIPQADALNLRKAWPRGKGLGGSGAINGMYWNRGNRENYEAWNTLNPGAPEDWGWDEVNRCIMKAENYTAPRQDQISQHQMTVEPDAHGQSGPIQAGFAQYMYDLVENWIPSLGAVGINAIDGGSGTTHGAYFCPITINTSNMTRSDSKAGYIDPLPPRDNLVILTGQQVTAINFNGSTDSNNNIIASGVTFQASSGAQSYTVNANREVILAGGTVGSPQILQLSGIGPQSTLSALGIESRIDLPVGYNLQDHVTATVEFSTPQGTLTWNNLSNDDALGASELTKYRDSRTGMWTFVNQAVAFPNMADLLDGSAANYASLVQRDLNETWQNAVEWKSLPDNVARGLSAQYQIQASHIDSEVGQVEMLFHLLAPNNNIAIQASLQHPWSRGTIFITSTDAFTAPAINPDYFSIGYDIDILNNGVQLARRIAAAAPMNTVCITETNPGTSFTAGSDRLNDWIRDDIGTTYHPIGTCSMLPRENGGVVDTQLLVYGSANIRVIDSSIIPLHMSAHTMGTTYGVAEKGAEIIKRRYWEVQPEVSSSSSSEGGAGGASRTTSGPGSSNTAAAGGAGVSSDSGLSNAAKIGVGVGAGVGAAALLAAIIAFCCIRRKKRSAPTDAAWYKGAGAGAGVGAGQEYDQVPKERDGDYPMANFTPPQAGYAQHGRTPSVSTMATADLASRDPMMASRRASSGFGFDNYGYDHSGQATPAERFDDGGYPTQPPSGAWSPAHQKYTQVQI